MPVPGTDPEREDAVAAARAVRQLLRPPSTAEDEGAPNEGLRERKKRQTRQLISDTATVMFLQQGFDQVRVADVAEACGVSEKTVYNYFPTKESLVLDREDEMVALTRRALGPNAPDGSPVDAFVAELVDHMASMACRPTDAGEGCAVFKGVGRFRALVESSPSLRAAQRDMMDRITRVAAEELAARAGVDPSDPEPVVAAVAICALWGVMFGAMERHGRTATGSAEEVGEAVAEDVRRAARLIDTGLWSFGLEVQGATSLQQLRRATTAANDARKQVHAALKAAKEAWMQVAEEARAHHDLHHEFYEERARAAYERGPRGRVRGGPPRRRP